MPVLAAVGEREARRIGEAAGRAVDHLGDHARASAPCARRRPGTSRSSAKSAGPAVGRGGERAVQAAEHHVLGPDVVVRRHHEMRQQRRLRRRRRPPLERRRPRATMPVRPEVAQQVELAARARPRPARSVRLTISPALRPVDRRVRRLDEARQALGQPVVAAGVAAVAVHALLDHDPLAVVGDDEAVQVELEAVLHRRAVDLGDEPARPRQRRAVEAGALADRRRARPASARECLPRPPQTWRPSSPASGASPRFSAPMHAGGDAGRVPVHPHHRAERLEPEGMGEPAQELVAAVVDARSPRRSPRRAASCAGRARPARGRRAAADRRCRRVGPSRSLRERTANM